MSPAEGPKRSPKLEQGLNRRGVSSSHPLVRRAALQPGRLLVAMCGLPLRHLVQRVPLPSSQQMTPPLSHAGERSHWRKPISPNCSTRRDSRDLQDVEVDPCSLDPHPRSQKVFKRRIHLEPPAPAIIALEDEPASLTQEQSTFRMKGPDRHAFPPCGSTPKLIRNGLGYMIERVR